MGVRMPNLTRLAHEGMRFDQAFPTCSSCSPSRASILTGRYPHQTGAVQLHQPLPGDQVDFTELPRQSGYWIAAAGKWHLGEQARAKSDLIRIPLCRSRRGSPSRSFRGSNAKLEADPDELSNLAGGSRYASMYELLRKILDRWSHETANRPPVRRRSGGFARETGELLQSRAGRLK